LFKIKLLLSGLCSLKTSSSKTQVYIFFQLDAKASFSHSSQSVELKFEGNICFYSK